MKDILENPNLPQGAVIALATLFFALVAWLPEKSPAPAQCERPLYMPTATDGPEYLWQWPLQETTDEPDDEPRRHKHRRRG